MVPLRHSTLGGNNSDRAARRSLTELAYPWPAASSLEEIPTSLAWLSVGTTRQAQAGRPQADLRHCGLRTGPTGQGSLRDSAWLRVLALPSASP